MVPAGVARFRRWLRRLWWERFIIVEGRERNDPVGFVKRALVGTETGTRKDSLFADLFQVCVI